MGKKQVKLQEQRLPFVITLKFYCHALQFQRAAFVAERKTHSSTYKQSEINRKKTSRGTYTIFIRSGMATLKYKQGRLIADPSNKWPQTFHLLGTVIIAGI